jgi:predicted PurR-regulated permease PerM
MQEPQESTAQLAQRRSAILAALALVGAFAALWILQRVLGAVFDIIKVFSIAFLIALALQPAVNALIRRRVPRMLAVLGPLLLVLAGAAVLGVIFIPPALAQAQELVKNLPTYSHDLSARALRFLDHYPWLQERLRHLDVATTLGERAGQIADAAGAIATNVASTVVEAMLVAFAAIFMLMQPEPLKRGIMGLMPDAYSEKANHVIGRLVAKLRAWIQGMVMLSVAVALLDFAGLTLIGLPYAALFAGFAGLLELIPTVGPVIAAIGPVLVALAIKPILAVYVVIVFVVVQQLEGNVLVPIIMSRALDLHPVSVFFGFLVMAALFGLFGAVIAVPTVACLKVFYDELYTPWAHPNQPRPESPPPRRRRRAPPAPPLPPTQGHE